MCIPSCHLLPQPRAALRAAERGTLTVSPGVGEKMKRTRLALKKLDLGALASAGTQAPPPAGR